MSNSYLKYKDYCKIINSLKNSEAEKLESGDCVLIRNLDTITTSENSSYMQEAGKWLLKDYCLSDNQSGTMLIINEIYDIKNEVLFPPEIKIELGLTGWYAIWLGIPSIYLKPVMANPSGIDIAINEDIFVHIGPERGARKGKLMGSENSEIMCFFKCAYLDGAVIRLRVPYGTHLPYPVGLVRALISSIKLIKLNDSQVQDWRKDISEWSNKKLIAVHDGFSPYWNATPGNEIDARYVESYRDSDVKIIMLQTPCTGVASWPSKVTTLVGEGLNDEEWAGRRYGDRKVHEYIKWAVDNGQEGFKVMPEYCRKYGMEFHLSIRTNLFFSENSQTNKFGSALEKYLNGIWWLQHPELRIEGSLKLDYSKKEARAFIIDIICEIASKYDIDGINLDFTRWPPVFDTDKHDDNVALIFIKEIKVAVSKIESQKNKKFQLSICAVEGYHSNLTLNEQKINLDKLLRSGLIDFVCIEAWDHTEYIKLAKKYGVSYYVLQDAESITVKGGWREDPDWKQGDRDNEDPVPGEEYEEQIPINSVLDPTEYDLAAKRYYDYGADGICIFNNMVGWRSQGRLGHKEELTERITSKNVWGQEVGPEISLA